MLQMTPDTLKLLRAAQEKANEKIRRSKPSKQWQLRRDRFKHLVGRTVEILKAGYPTYFAFEGATRHGLRSSLCLQGWPWLQADAEASKVIAAALGRVGAQRPTWNQGQPWWTEEGATQLERSHCERCSRPIEEAVAGRFCSTLCASAQNKERHRKSGEAMSQAEYLASVAANRPAPRPCQQCEAIFQPRHAEARFCSTKCAYASQRLRPLEVTCAQCGTTFAPKKHADQRYCSHACYAKGKAAVKHPARPCVVCETSFHPSWPHAIYCSTACQARQDRAKKAAKAPPRQCEQCKTYFKSDRAAARFCGTSCSALARVNKLRQEAFQCDPT